MLKLLIILAAAAAFIYFAQPIFEKFGPADDAVASACIQEVKVCATGIGVEVLLSRSIL